jgi:geranylgeranyl diphosphate synthase type I
VTGKPAGDDLREGKRTFLVAAAFDTADEAAARVLRAGLGDPALDEAGIVRLREIIAGTGALERTEARITELTGSALAALHSVDLAADGRQVLIDLAEAATSRLT